MSVEQTNVVNMIGTDIKSGNVKLTIFDHLDWDDVDYHLRILQDKLNTYLEFIENGEIYDNYLAAKNQSLVIKIMVKCKLSIFGEKLINFVNAITEKVEVLVLFRYMPGDSGVSDHLILKYID